MTGGRTPFDPAADVPFVRPAPRPIETGGMAWLGASVGCRVRVRGGHHHKREGTVTEIGDVVAPSGLRYPVVCVLLDATPRRPALAWTGLAAEFIVIAA